MVEISSDWASNGFRIEIGKIGDVDYVFIDLTARDELMVFVVSNQIPMFAP